MAAGSPLTPASRMTLPNSAVRLPPLGIGLYQLPGEACSTPVRSALAAGYRLIDTARLYRNEAEVGNILRGLSTYHDSDGYPQHPQSGDGTPMVCAGVVSATSTSPDRREDSRTAERKVSREDIVVVAKGPAPGRTSTKTPYEDALESIRLLSGLNSLESEAQSRSRGGAERVDPSVFGGTDGKGWDDDGADVGTESVPKIWPGRQSHTQSGGGGRDYKPPEQTQPQQANHFSQSEPGNDNPIVGASRTSQASQLGQDPETTHSPQLVPKQPSYTPNPQLSESRKPNGPREYVDLFLIHTPHTSAALRRQWWEALERLHSEGKVGAIGVSNYSVSHLEELKGYAKVWPPAVNQVELHPWHQQPPLTTHAHQNSIPLQSYSPLARATRLADPALLPLAAKHAKSPAQVLLRYALQKGWVPIVKAASEAHVREDIDVFDFELDGDDVRVLDGLDGGREGALFPRNSTVERG